MLSGTQVSRGAARWALHPSSFSDGEALKRKRRVAPVPSPQGRIGGLPRPSGWAVLGNVRSGRLDRTEGPGGERRGPAGGRYPRIRGGDERPPRRTLLAAGQRPPEGGQACARLGLGGGGRSAPGPEQHDARRVAPRLGAVAHLS